MEFPDQDAVLTLKRQKKGTTINCGLFLERGGLMRWTRRPNSAGRQAGFA
jgi:hypothetical protein